jgi:hypothetical protein
MFSHQLSQAVVAAGNAREAELLRQVIAPVFDASAMRCACGDTAAARQAGVSR